MYVLPVRKRNALTILFVLLASAAAFCCSLRSMQYLPVRSDLTISITHGGSPISGIEVRVFRDHDPSKVVLAGITDEHGIFQIPGLPPGRYDLLAEHKGFTAGHEWIEVTESRTAGRKARFTFEWDSEFQLKKVEGKLTALERGTTGNKIMDIVHPRVVPHIGVALSLENAFSNVSYRTVSDSTGTFIFEEVPSGIYVLTIAGGKTSMIGEAQETSVLIDVSNSAHQENLPLQLNDSGCGGASYQLASRN
jgi:hypothetical protein